MTYQIDTKTGRFVGMAYRQSADQGGTLLLPRWIVIHYTGGAGRGALSTLTAKDEDFVSAHTFTEKDGTATQLVRLDRIAYHAGVSQWAGLKRLNPYTFGLELANPGWRRPGTPDPSVWPTTGPIPHRNGGPFREWYLYPDAQIESVAQQCAALRRAYGSIEGELGHDDISPGRKWDPGPAFPWDTFRARVRELLLR